MFKGPYLAAQGTKKLSILVILSINSLLDTFLAVVMAAGQLQNRWREYFQANRTRELTAESIHVHLKVFSVRMKDKKVQFKIRI